MYIFSECDFVQLFRPDDVIQSGYGDLMAPFGTFIKMIDSLLWVDMLDNEIHFNFTIVTKLKIK